MIPPVTHVMPLAEQPGRNTFNGAETHLLTLMTAQAAAGQDVTFLVLGLDDGPQIRARLEELRQAGVTVEIIAIRRHANKLVHHLFKLAAIPAVAAHMRRHPDRVVHSHLEMGMQVAAAAAALTGFRRLVTTIHNNEPCYANPRWQATFRFLKAVTARWIAISHAVHDHLRTVTPIDPYRIAVIHYGVPQPPRPDRARLRHDWGVAEDAFVVGVVARLEPQKNLGLLLRALHRLPPLHGVLVGGGTEEAALKRQAAALGLSNVTFLGPRADGPAQMAGFDAFCLPSHWEGLGLVLIEAMLQGVPVIASRAGAIPEVLDDGRQGWLFEVDDLEGLVEGLRQMAADRAQWAERTEGARDYAKARFSVEAMRDKTLAVYENLCR